ncbi:MAG: cadherin-like domain-containing protein [Acidimicrobiales bacterium]|nr:cadherin-like domain-containing protein [Acidimicrobiales bacterium]
METDLLASGDDVVAPLGPTQMDPSVRWKPRRTSARLLRIASFVFPVGLSVCFALLLIRILPAPANPGETAGWWATLGITVILFAIGSERIFRRLLPIAAVLDMTLAFPDQAPSRFATALRAPSLRALQRSIEDRTIDEQQTPTEAATQLLGMANALSSHDRATRGHTERVRAYAQLIGEEMGLKDDELEMLRWSALIHDVGKLRVRPSVLNTVGRPSDTEWNELAQHPLHGAEMTEPLRPWLGEWVNSAGQHHEKWDGSGYPFGLRREEISLSARIVAVADAYDVMTSARSYKNPFPAADARAELARCAGSQFDPDVVKAMLNVSIAQKRFSPLAAWIAQVPILGASWPNSGITISSTVAAVIAAFTLAPGVFSPELIAYSNLTAAEDTQLSFSVNAPGTDLPDSVEILKVLGPAAAEWNGQEIVITPEPNANGDVTVRYEACWSNGGCLKGEAATTFTAVNDAPTASDDDETATAPGPITIRPLLNDSDLDSDTLTIDSAEVTEGAAEVAVTGDALVVTPDHDKPQIIALAYTIIDGFGGSDIGLARITVPDFNASPTALDDVATVPATETVVAAVLANDSDPSEDALTIISAAVIDGIDLGRVEISGDNIIFTANDRVGAATIAYEISDGNTTAKARLVVTITPPPPITAPDRIIIPEDSAGSVNVLTNDTAPESKLDPASVRITTTRLGTAIHAGDGVIAFQGDRDAYGLGSVTYEICNTFGLCSLGYLSVEITRVNDLPRFSAGPSVVAAPGASFVQQWATNLSVGEDNEPTQSLSFITTAVNTDLFTVQPWIDPNGVLRFTGSGSSGTTAVTTAVSDGLDSSGPVTFSITIQ